MFNQIFLLWQITTFLDIWCVAGLKFKISRYFSTKQSYVLISGFGIFYLCHFHWIWFATYCILFLFTFHTLKIQVIFSRWSGTTRSMDILLWISFNMTFKSNFYLSIFHLRIISRFCVVKIEQKWPNWNVHFWVYTIYFKVFFFLSLLPLTDHCSRGNCVCTISVS